MLKSRLTFTMNKTTEAVLSLGSNIGDRLSNLQVAVHLLSENPAVTITSISSVYETEPVGGVAQQSFYNIAIILQTSLSAQQLLDFLHEIEQHLHRKRLVHWGPRTIDLDIIYYGQEYIKTSTLTVPHPEMGNRRFVLIPTLEAMTADDVHYQEVQRLLDTTTDQNWLKKKYSSEVLEWTK